MEQKAEQRDKILNYLGVLCRQLGPRPVGSENNRQTAEFVASQFKTNGHHVIRQSFECSEWKCDKVRLYFHDKERMAFASPFSPPCHLNLPVKAFDNQEKLMNADLKGKIAVLHGDLTKESLMPKNFRFYNPDEHKIIIRAIEKAAPEGIILVSHSLEHPKPVIEDGDFTIPSVYISRQEAKSLLKTENETATLSIESHRKPAQGENVIVHFHPEHKRSIVLTAHLDTKPNSPGAIDNASGIATLLLLGEMIADDSFRFNVELAFLNGEDYYNTPGEILYIDSIKDEWKNRILAINCDGVGLSSGKTGIALMEANDRIATFFTRCRVNFPGIVHIHPWYQGDHMLFVKAGIPTMAITSTTIFDAVDTITHTPDDTPEKLDPERIVELANFLHQLLHNLNNE